MSDFYLLITDAGKSLEAAAHASGETVKLTDFAVGDGGGAPVTPDAAQTALVNETFRDAISSLTVSTADNTVLEAECIIPKESGGYTIREIGIYADDGTLYAVGNFAEQEKPDPDSGYAASLQIIADLAVSDTSDITLTVQDASYLTETQANTIYLRQDKRFSEIADQGEDAKAEARENLGLKSGSVHDVTASNIDTTAGNLLQFGDFGVGKAIMIPKTTDLSVFFETAPGAFYHCDGSSDYTHAPSFSSNWFDVHVTVHEVTNYRTLIAISASGQIATAAITAGNFSGWRKVYSDLEKPTPREIFPLAEGIGDAADLNSYTTPGLYYQPANAQAGTGKNYPEANAGSLEVYKHAGTTQVYRIYNSSRTYIRSLYGSAWSAWTKQYDTANPPPATDLSAYMTTSAANAKFVQGIQFGAQGSHPVSDNNSFSVAGNSLTGFMCDGSNDDLDTLYSKAIQRNINGTWVTISG